jgi:hypothetical protein
MIYSDELPAVAKRIFCFGTPKEALEFPLRFLTYAMTYATDEDIEILRKYFSDQEFKAALDDSAPGIFDQSSWTKWNQHYDRTPHPITSEATDSRRGPGHSSRFLPPQILNTATRDINLLVRMSTAGEAESPTFQIRASRAAFPLCNFLFTVLYTYTMKESVQTVTAAGTSYRE